LLQGVRKQIELSRTFFDTTYFSSISCKNATRTATLAPKAHQATLNQLCFGLKRVAAGAPLRLHRPRLGGLIFAPVSGGDQLVQQQDEPLAYRTSSAVSTKKDAPPGFHLVGLAAFLGSLRRPLTEGGGSLGACLGTVRLFAQTI